MTIDISTLPNGVRVITDSYDSPLAAVAVTIEAGTRHEMPMLNGVAHFLEHMAFKGTANRSAQQIVAEIENRGGRVNAATRRDTTQFYASVLREDVSPTLEVIADIVLNSTFPEEEVDRERGVILQENRDHEDDYQAWLGDRLMETAFSGALSLPGLGRPETLQIIGRPEIKGFVDQHYGPGKIIVGAAGGVDPERFIKAASEAFGSLRKRAAPGDFPTAYRGGVYRQVADTPNVDLMIAFTGPPLGHPDLPGDCIFTAAIGGCESSPIFQAVREKRGLCYHVLLSGEAWRQAGLTVATMSCGEDQAEEAITVLCEELQRSRDGLTPAQLSLGRTLCKAQVVMGLETTWERLSAAQHHLAIHGKKYDLAEELARFEAVGPADIARTVERMCSARPTIAIRGPESVCDLDIEGMLG